MVEYLFYMIVLYCVYICIKNNMNDRLFNVYIDLLGRIYNIV